MQEFLGRKSIVAHLDYYLEDVNRSDGCTALLCAVRRGDYGVTELVSITHIIEALNSSRNMSEPHLS